MRIPFIHRRFEGERLHQGFNWNRDRASRFQLITYLWRVIVYFRWRSALVGGDRIIFGVDYVRPYVLGGISIDFDTQSINARGNKVSLEALEMIANPRPGYYHFSPEAGWIHALTARDLLEERITKEVL